MIFSVMQPYLFPYLGYYQLVANADKFVFYDDVTFIKGGYINRNSILSHNGSQRFTLPVKGLSSNAIINTLYFDNNVRKILKTIQQSYTRSPFFNEVYPVIESVFMNSERNVAKLCYLSIKNVFEYLGMENHYVFSSDLEYSRDLSAPEKLIKMSKILSAGKYINSAGGMELYNKEYFSDRGVILEFMKMKNITYAQGNCEKFTPYLSMIDVLMWNDRETVKSLLLEFELL